MQFSSVSRSASLLPDRALLSRNYRSNDGITEIEVERVDPGVLFPSDIISCPGRRRRDRLATLSDHVIEDGMPRLVADEVFEEVQRRFAINKRRGAKTKAELAAQGEDASDYWLTGRAYCLACGGPMEGVSGTSKTVQVLLLLEPAQEEVLCEDRPQGCDRAAHCGDRRALPR